MHSILSQEIAKVIPDMSKDTAKAIFDAKVDLARLGPPPEKANDVKREFNNIIDVRLCYKSAMMCYLWLYLYETYRTLIRTIPNLFSFDLHLPHRARNRTFASIIVTLEMETIMA